MSQEFLGPLTVTSAQGGQGGSLELGATLGAAPATPHVDFHFGLGAAQDYNVRLLNAADNRLDVVTALGGPVLSIQADKIGIGTTTPGAKLVVHEDAGGAELRVDGLNGTVGLSLGADAAQPWVGTRTNHALRLFTSNTEKVRVQTNGNVGIGTPSPTTKLDVAGNVQILTGSNPMRFTAGWTGFPDAVTNQAEISNDTATYKTLMIIGNRSAGFSGPGLGRRVSVWDRLEVNGTFKTTGNVGLGIEPSDFRLDVAGRIRLRQGGHASAGLWLFQDGTNTDRAFIGMQSNNLVGLYGVGVGWAFSMDVNDGSVYIGGNKTGNFVRFNDDLWFSDPQNGTIHIRSAHANNFGTMVGFFQAPSSRAFKKEIRIVQDADLEHLLAETLQTDLVHFRYKNDALSQRLHLGVIAEDAPDTIVGTDGQSLATSEYIAMLHGAIKALAGKFVALRTANEHLQARGGLLESKLQDLERRLSGGEM